MKHSTRHSIDFLFPLALLFVFSAAALTSLLFSADTYQRLTAQSKASFEQETALSYLTGKIRQQSQEGTSIYLTRFDSCDSLAIEEQYEDASYITYIYETNGELKELFLKKGTQAKAASGTTILQIHALQMEEVRDSLLRFTCISADGSQSSRLISILNPAF